MISNRTVISNRHYRRRLIIRSESAPYSQSIRILAATTFVAYLFQVSFFGPIRYFLSINRLEILWYIPDLLGFICICAALLKGASNRNFRILIFLIAIILYLIEGYLISASVSSVLSTFKALVPIFCGFLIDREMLSGWLLRRIIFVFLIAACVGVVLSRSVAMPWADLQFEGVGVVQTFKVTQWLLGGDVRNYGFAGDQHGAAWSILLLFMMFSIRANRTVFYVMASVSCVSIFLTTSRTNFAAILFFVFLCLAANPWGQTNRRYILVWCMKISFFAIFVPLILIGISALFPADSIPVPLLSLWIRGTSTWFTPFQIMNDLAPLAMAHGFGLGGFGFGLLQSDLANYATPVDNFILFNYLCFGIPYIIFYYFQCRQMLYEEDLHRILIYIVIAMVGLTLRGWSDSSFMLLFGYSIASLFFPPERRQDASEKMGHPAKPFGSRRLVDRPTVSLK